MISSKLIAVRIKKELQIDWDKKILESLYKFYFIHRTVFFLWIVIDWWIFFLNYQKNSINYLTFWYIFGFKYKVG